MDANNNEVIFFSFSFVKKRVRPRFAHVRCQNRKSDLPAGLFAFTTVKVSPFRLL